MEKACRRDISASLGAEIETQVDANQSETDQPSSIGLAMQLSEKPDIVGPNELRGVTVNVAENKYIGRRRGERTNTSFGKGTLRHRARHQYHELLCADRRSREFFSDPALALLTLVIDPTYGDGLIGPVEQLDLIRSGMSYALRRMRDRIGIARMTCFGVRELDADGIAHAHLYVAGDNSQIDTLDMLAGVESHVRQIPLACPEDHTYKKAIRWDPTPENTVKQWTEGDKKEGAVHPFARYIAGSLPNLGPAGDLTPIEIRQGTLEWAATTTGVSKAGAGFE